MSSTGNIRGQRTQSSTGGYKTLASSIASGNNSGCFKRIYLNAYERYNGNSDLALSYTLGINKGDYAHTNSQALTTVKSASHPQVGSYGKAGLVNSAPGATTLSAVHLGATRTIGMRGTTSTCCSTEGPGTASVFSYINSNLSSYFARQSYTIPQGTFNGFVLTPSGANLSTFGPLAIQSGQAVFYTHGTQTFTNQVVVNSGAYLFDNSTSPPTQITSSTYQNYINDQMFPVKNN